MLVIACGGWLDPETGEWYDDQGQSLGRCRPSEWPVGCLVKTILTCAHLDQNPAHNDPANLAALPLAARPAPARPERVPEPAPAVGDPGFVRLTDTTKLARKPIPPARSDHHRIP